MCVCMYTYYAKVHTHARAHTCIHRAGDKCGWGSEIYTYMHSCMRTYIHTLTCVDAEDDGGYDERVADKRYAFCYRGVLATKRHQHLPHAAAVSRSVDAQTHRCFFKHACVCVQPSQRARCSSSGAADSYLMHDTVLLKTQASSCYHDQDKEERFLKYQTSPPNGRSGDGVPSRESRG